METRYSYELGSTLMKMIRGEYPFDNPECQFHHESPEFSIVCRKTSEKSIEIGYFEK